MAALRSTGWLSHGVIEAGAVAQDIALGAALFGLGSSVRVRELLDTGLRATVMALCAWALIAALAFGAVHLMAGYEACHEACGSRPAIEAANRIP